MLYHGGYCQIDNPKIIKGKYGKDFGTGFYCTEISEQAVRWARRFDTPVVSIYEYLPDSSLNIQIFPEMSDEWLDFIVKSRAGYEHNFDIVSGPMANDQIYNYVSDYINGLLTKEQFWILAKFKHPTHQVCFCSDESLKCLTFINSKHYDR